MQRITLTVLFLLSSIACYSQFFYLGYSEKALLFEVINDEDFINYETKVVSDTSKLLTWYDKSSKTRIIVCLENDISYLTILKPDDTQTLNRLVKEFNKYIIINDREWKVYLDDRIFKIELKYLPELKSHFAISEI